MKVLVVKTSSMGDVLHTLPALTDAGKHYPGIYFDWLVEENFAQIPSWHPLVDRTIPVALRRWRKHFIASCKSGEWKQFYQHLRETEYDAVIDAQGLLKSALLASASRGLTCGMDKKSAREPIASLLYKCCYPIPRKQHAVTRIRQLFALALGYPQPNEEPDYSIVPSRLQQYSVTEDYLVFIHGTTWKTKLWPERYWITLAQQVVKSGYQILLPWGSEEEKRRADRIAGCKPDKIIVLPKLQLSQVASVIANAKAAVAVDTGLGHLAAALAVPTVSLYGPTDPQKVGTCGAAQVHLTASHVCKSCTQDCCAMARDEEISPACFASLTPELVERELASLLKIS